ncbi:MAG: hypothetical protein SFU98_21125 [Leptospiraceae bacterium]|nr:hypothetical protein [Leptospiraceae bacterium]
MRLTVLAITLLIAFVTLSSEEWSDLDTNEKKDIYGSEKRKKFKANNLFFEWEDWKDHYSLEILYLFRDRDYPKYTSSRFFPFYSSLKSKIDEREKYRILNYTYRNEYKLIEKNFYPIVFYGIDGKETNNYHHAILPFYFYKSHKKRAEGFEFLFFPFPFYYKTSTYPLNKDSIHEEKTSFTIFYYRNLEEDRGEIQVKHKSVYGFPAIPFLYYSNLQQGEGRYQRLLTLFQWNHDSKEKLTDASFFPFIFYKKNDSIYLPLLLFKKDLSPKPDYGETVNLLFLYYNNWSPGKNSLVFGTYLSFDDSNTNSEFRAILPIYAKSKSEKLEWSYLFPIYINYNDKEADYSFNLITSSRYKSGILDPNISIDKKEEKWYIDTDFTFLYYLANFSFRESFSKPKFFRNVKDRILSIEETKQIKEKQEQVPKEENVQLRKRRSVTRDESSSFQGYSLLFGLTAFERADSRRHFRLLPLSWLSWDEKNDDKLYVFPPLFLNYKSYDLEYTVLFPFYGKQKDDHSEIRAYFLNGLILESDKEKKETSIIWPLINIYTSDKNSGHRFLPFYIHQESKIKERSTKENYTIFSYYQSVKNNDLVENKGSKSKYFFVWPVFLKYDSYDWEEQNHNLSRYSLWVTPFFYHNSSENEFRTNLFWFIDYKFNKYQRKNISKKEDYILSHLLIFPFYKGRDNFFWIFPLTFTEYKSIDDFDTFTAFQYIQNNSYKFRYNFLYIWDFAYNKKNAAKVNSDLEIELLFTSFHYSDTSSSNKQKLTSSTKFYGIWGYLFDYHKFDDKLNHANLLWLGYYNKDKEITHNYLPFYRETKTNEFDSKIYGPVLYTYTSKEKELELGLLGLGYWNLKDRNNSEPEETYVLLGTLYREYTKKERGYKSRGSFWGFLWEYQTEEETGFKKFSFLKLFSYTVDGK